LKLTLITPTRDRVITFGMLERFIRRQTYKPFTWIIVDDGIDKVNPTMGQIHIQLPRVRKISYLENLLVALDEVDLDNHVVVLEDDDWYGPECIEWMVNEAELYDVVFAHAQFMYHVRRRRWQQFGFKGIGRFLSMFCIMSPKSIPVFRESIRYSQAMGVHSFRRATMLARNFMNFLEHHSLGVSMLSCRHTCQLKGVPGPGITSKHSRFLGNDDFDGDFLRERIGKEDADILFELVEPYVGKYRKKK